MNENLKDQTLAGMGALGQQQAQQLNVVIDDDHAETLYTNNVRVSGSPEDITVELASNLKQTGPAEARLSISHRIILNPWAAKRMAMALQQAVDRYEQTYGELELDARKRAQKS